MALSVTSKAGNAHRIATWTGETTAGNASIPDYQPEISLTTARVQVGGTFGGATVVLQGSNDDITYVTLNDIDGTAISFTAAGQRDFTTGAAFIKPSISGGTGDSINVIVSHWSR